MGFDFVIIQTSDNCTEQVVTIYQKIKQIDRGIPILIDTNYKQSINTKMNKYKKNEKDIIIVNLQNIQKNLLDICLFDNDWKNEKMNVVDFLELLQKKCDSDSDIDSDDSDIDSDTATVETHTKNTIKNSTNSKTTKTNSNNKSENIQPNDNDNTTDNGCIIM